MYKKPDDIEADKGVYAMRIVLVFIGYKYKGNDWGAIDTSHSFSYTARSFAFSSNLNSCGIVNEHFAHAGLNLKVK